MDKFFILIGIILLLSEFSCRVESTKGDLNFLITKDSVGEFTLGQDVSKIKESNEVRFEENGNFYFLNKSDTLYQVKLNKNKEKISEIIVLSPKMKMTNGIHVGMSFDSVRVRYPEIKNSIIRNPPFMKPQGTYLPKGFYTKVNTNFGFIYKGIMLDFFVTNNIDTVISRIYLKNNLYN